jgi:hypothetical protein
LLAEQKCSAIDLEKVAQRNRQNDIAKYAASNPNVFLRRHAANAVARMVYEPDKHSANAAGGPANENKAVLAMVEQRFDASCMFLPTKKCSERNSQEVAQRKRQNKANKTTIRMHDACAFVRVRAFSS